MKIIIEKIDWFLARLVSLLMGLLVVDVTWQVISRFLINKPSVYTEEIAIFLVIWISLLGAAYTYRQGAHLGLDIVVQKLDEAKRAIAHKIADTVCLAFALIVLVYGGWELVYLNIQLNQTSAALQMSIWIVYSVIPISGVLFSIYALERIFIGPAERTEK